MAKIKKKNQVIPKAGKGAAKRELSFSMMRLKTAEVIIEISMENTQKHKSNLPYDLGITTHRHLNKRVGTQQILSQLCSLFLYSQCL